jgi:hypothetical protein
MDVPGRSARQILLDEMGNFIGSDLTPSDLDEER